MAEIKKLTKKEKFAMIKEYIADNEMLTEFIDNEINLLTKKASSSKKTKDQVINEEIKDKIIIVLTKTAMPMTITDIQKADSELATYSNQKISALITQLKEEKRLQKLEIYCC
mgnify:CR=1 FL=1